jgi:GH15 family glucan-1,4-alpha-glucosidase
LIDDRGAFVWSCYPNFDGEPIFCQLLTPAPKPVDEGDVNPNEHSRWHGDNPATDGAFLIKLSGCNKITQHYEDHAPILVTTLEAPGGAIEIVDFAPHMLLNERIFRPALFVRMVRPLRGMPLISVHCRPLIKYGETRPATARGSNHCRFKLTMHDVRLTTDLPVTFIEHERVFALTRASTMIFGPDETIERNVSEVGRHFHGEFAHARTHPQHVGVDSTLKFWHAWIQSLSIPFEFQAPVIHSAIVLKLCSVAETGAIIASVTTSIPEAPNSQRNWDYRFCWLRDSHFTVSALVELGKFDVLEDYISFVINVIHQQLQMSEPNYDDMDHLPLLTHNNSASSRTRPRPLRPPRATPRQRLW